MARVRFKARFYVVLFLFLAAVSAAALYFVLKTKDGELTSDSMRLSETVKAVVIRDEISVPTERYDKILFDVAEGARVSEQDQIAQVFKWGYQEENMQALLDIQQQIQEHQFALLEGIVKPDLETVNIEIQKKQLEIRAASSGEIERDMFELELELKALLNSRMELLSDVQADEALLELYALEEEQLNNISAWKRDIINTIGDGVVSFYFDGYERALSSDSLDMLSSDLLSRVLKGGAIEAPSGDSMESPLYRLIDDEHFYIAFLTEASAPFRLTGGEVYTVIIDGYSSIPFTAAALAPSISGTQVVNILEIHQPMGDLMGVRVVEAVITKDVSGIKLPLSAIRIQDGLPGILRIAGSETTWVEVEVLSQDGEDAIIRAKNQNETLTPGVRYKR